MHLYNIDSFSINDTEKIATMLAVKLKTGDVIALSGDLGAGKTYFVQAAVRALGIIEPVTSPTFSLLQIYEGTIPVHHFDLYRLNSPAELEEIGFYEYTSYGLSFIEWPDQFVGCLPSDYLWVDISRGSLENQRVITFKPQGQSYERLCKELVRDYADISN